MDPSAITAIDSSTDAFTDYRRVEFVGANPKFKATDWGLIFQADPERFPSGTSVGVMTSGWNALGTLPLNGINVVEDPKEGRVFEVTNGGSAGFNGYYALVPSMTPTRISYRFSCFGGNVGAVFLGTATVPLSVIVQQCTGPSVTFYSDGGSISVAIDGGNWHTVELRDIDWTARTWDVYFDGGLVTDPEDSAITADDFAQYAYLGTIGAVESFWIGNQTESAASQFADIQMR